MLSERKFGFRKGKSCVTSLLSYYDRVAETIQERDGWVDSTYLHSMKVFDTVPHYGLMWNLNTKEVSRWTYCSGSRTFKRKGKWEHY